MRVAVGSAVTPTCPSRLSPAERLAIKGPDAVVALVSSLLPGTGIDDTSKLMLIDLNPQLHADWALGAWRFIQTKKAKMPVVGYVGISADRNIAMGIKGLLRATLVDELGTQRYPPAPLKPDGVERNYSCRAVRTNTKAVSIEERDLRKGRGGYQRPFSGCILCIVIARHLAATGVDSIDVTCCVTPHT